MQTQTVGHKAQKQARKPGPVVVAAGAGAFAALAAAAKPAPQPTPTKPAAAVLTPLPQATAPATGPAPAQQATVATLPPVTVALRGGLAIASVALTGKPYRVTAAHNVAWWEQVTQAIKAGNGTASVAHLCTQLQPPVPAIMVGYLVRRGYLKAA